MTKMTTLYRIKCKVIEPPDKVYEGERVVEQPVDRYIDFLHKTHPDASYIYLELLEEFEQEEIPLSATGSMIVLGTINGLPIWVQKP